MLSGGLVFAPLSLQCMEAVYVSRKWRTVAPISLLQAFVQSVHYIVLGRTQFTIIARVHACRRACICPLVASMHGGSIWQQEVAHTGTYQCIAGLRAAADQPIATSSDTCAGKLDLLH